jgi:zinc/manganese transport system substrate-binding protein
VRMIIIRTRMRTIFISVLLALTAVLAACGSDDGSEADGPRVVATTGIVADIAREVAGPEAEVEQVIPDGSSPHDFQLSARDRHVLEQADLLVVNGEGLEAGLPIDDVDGPRWALAEHVGPLLPFETEGTHGDDVAPHDDEDEHAHGDEAAHSEEEDEHAHGAHDPHVWMDPSRVARALPSLADAFAKIDPSGAEGYRERTRRYADRLRELDSELERTLDAVPASKRGLITSHDSLGYLADRYGFAVIATAFPASGPEAEGSAARIEELRRAVSDSGVQVVFAQQEDDPGILRRIAAATGVEIEDGLIVESPASAGSYEAMLRLNAELITNALGDSARTSP